MSETRWLDEEQQRAWRSYIEATTMLLDALDRQLQQDSGMPHGYFEILVRLSEPEDRTMRMSELADATRSSRSRLSHAVSRLEERGWIARQDCETDRRGQLARLTDRGAQALAEAAPGHVHAVREHVIDRLSSEQITQLANIAERIVAGFAAA
ncbi:MAG: MarR family winged helix-turn-helix transcriptional regulator [Jatrophihabitantaceae bacterium]